MKPAQRAGLATSLVLHGLVAFSLVWQPPVDDRRKPVKADPQLVEPVAEQLKGYDGEGVGLACGGSNYDGLGIMTDGFGRVIDVGPNTPAERAGLLRDDIFLNSEDFWPGKFKPGHNDVLKIRRGAQRLDLPVTIGVICRE